MYEKCGGEPVKDGLIFHQNFLFHEHSQNSKDQLKKKYPEQRSKNFRVPKKRRKLEHNTLTPNFTSRLILVFDCICMCEYGVPGKQSDLPLGRWFQTLTNLRTLTRFQSTI